MRSFSLMKEAYSKTPSPPPVPVSVERSHVSPTFTVLTSAGRKIQTPAADTVSTNTGKIPGLPKTPRPPASRGLSASSSRASTTRPSPATSCCSTAMSQLDDSSDEDSDSDSDTGSESDSESGSIQDTPSCRDTPVYVGSNVNSPSPVLSLAQRPERSQTAPIPDGHNQPGEDRYIRKLRGIIAATSPDTSTESELPHSVHELRAWSCGSNDATPRYVGSSLTVQSPDLKLAEPPGKSQTAPAPDGHNPPGEDRYIRKMRGAIVQAEKEVADKSRIKEETKRLRAEVKVLQQQKQREERAEQKRLRAREERAAEHRELLTANNIQDDGGTVVWIQPGGLPLSSGTSSPSDMPGVPRLKYRGYEMRFYGCEPALDVLRIPPMSPTGPEDAEFCQPLPVTPPPLEVVGHTYKAREPSPLPSLSRAEQLLEECHRIQEAPRYEAASMVNMHNEPVKNVHFILSNNYEKWKPPAPPPPPPPPKVSQVQLELGSEAPYMTRPAPPAATAPPLAPRLRAAKRAKEKNNALLKKFPDPSQNAHVDYVTKRNSSFMAHVEKTSRDAVVQEKGDVLPPIDSRGRKLVNSHSLREAGQGGGMERKGARIPSSVSTLPPIQHRTSEKGLSHRRMKSDPVFPTEVPSMVAALRPKEARGSTFRLPPVFPNIQIPSKRRKVPECFPTWKAKNTGSVHGDNIRSDSNKENYERLPVKPSLPALPRMKRAQRGQNILRNVANVARGRV